MRTFLYDFPYHINNWDVIFWGEYSNHYPQDLQDIADHYFLIYKAQRFAESTKNMDLDSEVLQKELIQLSYDLRTTVEAGDEAQETYEHAIRTLTKNVPARKAVDELVEIIKKNEPLEEKRINLLTSLICASYNRDIDKLLELNAELNS